MTTGFPFCRQRFAGFAALLITALAAARCPAEIHKVTTVEGITEYRLDNGLQVLLFPDPSTSAVTNSSPSGVGGNSTRAGASVGSLTWPRVGGRTMRAVPQVVQFIGTPSTMQGFYVRACRSDAARPPTRPLSRTE